MQTPLILASTPIEANRRFGSALDQQNPRQDYIEVARMLGAEIMGPDLFHAAWYRKLRYAEEQMKLNLMESVTALRRLSNHSKILSTSERVAIPLEAMLQVSPRRVPHVVIAHKLSSRFKSSLFRLWPIHQSFSHVICVCQAQADYAINTLGIPASKVDFIYDKVDKEYFRPQKSHTGDYVLSVGQEQRDYHTLLKATAGTGIRVIIVASSRWSDREMEISVNGAEHVTVLSNISYAELRDLYAEARLVAVPLFDVPYAAGVNTVLEAMAMAKPLIVSRSEGIRDYVMNDVTGKYVVPQNTHELKAAILELWTASAYRERLGANARQMVDERANLDEYVHRIVQIMLRSECDGTCQL